MGIYDASGPNGGPGALKASTASFTPVKGWNTAKVVTPVSLAAGRYWLAYLPSSNALSFAKINATGDCKYYSYSFGSLASKFSTSPASCNPTTWSFYATLDGHLDIAHRRQWRMRLLEQRKSYQRADRQPLHRRHGVDCQRQRPWSWSCAGSSGGTTATCSATKVASAQPVNGVCGTSNGASLTSAPTANLCTAGTASAVSGSGPWSWNCAGSNGGSTASCSAIKTASTGTTAPTGGSASGLLTADRNASANWKTAGMLSQGGIPNRTTVCKTVSPLGGGKDDTANIQSADLRLPCWPGRPTRGRHIHHRRGQLCSAQQGVTLRGAGPGATTLQRTNGAQLEPGPANGSNPSPLVILGPARYGPWFGNPDLSTNSVNLTADGAAASTER